MPNTMPPPPAAPAASGKPARRPLSLRTQQQMQTRLAGSVALFILLGPGAFVVGAVAHALKTRSRHAVGIQVAIALSAGLGLLLIVLQRQAILEPWQALRLAGRMVAWLPKHIPPLQKAALLWPPLATAVGTLWLYGTALSGAVALFLENVTVEEVDEQEDKRRQARLAQQLQRTQRIQTRSAQAPATSNKELVLGMPISGELPWRQGPWATYPPVLLGRHAVVIGGSGTGKTETSLRLAYGTALSYNWKVFYLDCKGDREMGDRFMEAMALAGRTSRALFPDAGYDGWRGDGTALLNRLMAVVDYSEPYYRDITKMILDLAVHAPGGPPRSSDELLRRLSPTTLKTLYAGHPDEDELVGIDPKLVHSAHNRYRAFFRALGAALDGHWAFEDVDTGYILLNGLALKDQTASLGRFMLEDFAHYVSERKPPDQRLLLIIDEFPAIAFGGAHAATLFEMVRSKGAGVIVTAQSYAGLGDDADRILGAAASLILHQCADAERVLHRAGLTIRYSRSVAFADRGMSASGRSYGLGEGAIREQEETKIHPNAVKALLPGQCFVISGGEYALISISRIPRPSSAAAAQVPRPPGRRWLRRAVQPDADTVAAAAPSAVAARRIERIERSAVVVRAAAASDEQVVAIGSNVADDISTPPAPIAPPRTTTAEQLLDLE